jgi:hypothetical protein
MGYATSDSLNPHLRRLPLYPTELRARRPAILLQIGGRHQLLGKMGWRAEWDGSPSITSASPPLPAVRLSEDHFDRRIKQVVDTTYEILSSIAGQVQVDAEVMSAAKQLR